MLTSKMEPQAEAKSRPPGRLLPRLGCWAIAAAALSLSNSLRKAKKTLGVRTVVLGPAVSMKNSSRPAQEGLLVSISERHFAKPLHCSLYLRRILMKV